jgi:nucleotide-binding universal stress UspA family protein
MFRHLLIATDGSAVAALATRLAVDLAKTCGATITAMHVIEPFHATTYGEMMLPTSEAMYLDNARMLAAGYLLEVEQVAEEGGVPCTTVYEIGEPVHHVIEGVANERGCDLIVVGSHGRRGLQRLLLGSEAQKILLTTCLPVLVCHASHAAG